MIRRLPIALFLLCAACAAESPPEGAAAGTAFRAPDAEVPAAGTSTEAYLVWSAAGPDSTGRMDAPGETVWIDGEGKVLARRAGVVAAGSGGLWAWTEGKESKRGVDCECLRNADDPDNATCMLQSEVKTVHLVDLLGGRRVPVLAAEDDSINAPPEQSAAPLAGVGPYLFVETDQDLYACGAHGFHAVTARVHDLSRAAAPVELLDSAAAESVVAREGDEARRMLASDFDFESAIEGLELTKVEAKWTPAGMLNVGYQLTTGTCYACSDGLSSSYTRSAVVPADSVPPRLAEWAQAPEAVRRYWRTAPPAERAGWSRVDAPDPAAALARFRQP